MALDAPTPLQRIEQETAALTQRWGELRAGVIALAIADAQLPRGDDDVLVEALRTAIDACDQAQAELLALDAQRRALLRQPPDRGHVSKGMAANRAAWLTATRLKLLRHAERADRISGQRLELAAAVLREALTETN